MGALAAGRVVLVRFPFSDLTGSRLRPALVVAEAGRGDWVLCQVTSNAYGDPRSLEISSIDFASGSLHRRSFIRPGKLFTAHASVVERAVGTLTTEKLTEVRDAVTAIIRGE